MKNVNEVLLLFLFCNGAQGGSLCKGKMFKYNPVRLYKKSNGEVNKAEHRKKRKNELGQKE